LGYVNEVSIVLTSMDFDWAFWRNSFWMIGGILDWLNAFIAMKIMNI
jgi:hypothetical protein